MKKFNVFLLAVVAIVATSCNFFNTDSPSAADASAFTSTWQTEQVVGSLYEIMMEENSYRHRLGTSWTSIPTDIEGYRGTAQCYGDYTMTSVGYKDLTSAGKNPWVYLTRGIEYANLALDGMDQYSDTTDASFRYLYGEVLTIRAWFFYEMTKLWGDVPGNFSPMDLSDPNAIYPEKVDRNIIYEHLRADLKKAWRFMGPSAKIAWVNANNNVERMNGEFALGLLARVDLVYAGKGMRPNTWVKGGGSTCSVDFNAKDPQKRIELLNEVIWACEQVIKENGGIKGGKLMENYEDVFKNICANVKSFDKTETLFEIPFANAVRGQILNRSGQYMESAALGHLKNTYQDPANADNHSGRNMKVIVTPSFVYKFSANDKRKFVTFSPFRWDYAINTKTGVSDAKVVYPKLENIANFTLAKYRYEWLSYRVETAEDGLNLPIMRYSDILLMLAEASIGSVSGVTPTYVSQYSGEECFQAVRERAGLTDNKALTMEAIQDERAFEFCGEHIRKYDLMRWGIFAEKLKEAQRLNACFKNKASIDASEEYSDRVPEKYYVKFRENPALSQNGERAFEIASVYGLALDETESVVGMDDNKSLLTTPGALYKCPDDVLEYRQYWPIFDIILGSNPNLWNDYGY